MKKKSSYITLALLLILLASSSFFDAGPATKAKDIFLSSVKDLQNDMIEFKGKLENAGTEKELQASFKKLRISYKKCELFLSYFSPLTESAINGPNIHSVEEERFPEEESPHGFQVIEEILFPSYNADDQNVLINEIDRLMYNTDQFLRFSNSFAFQEQFAFDAMEQEVIRIAVLGLAGFDSPVLNYSFAEGATALSTLKECLKTYGTKSSRKTATWQDLIKRIDHAISLLNGASDFNSFDRLAFIKNEAMPLHRQLVILSQEWKIAPIKGLRPTRQNATSFWANGFFDIDFFKSDASSASSKGRIILGKKLFNDPILSGNGKRSCASCHNPHKGFADGLPKSFNIDEVTHANRNSPTLYNAGFQPFFFYDMRARTLEAQLDTVLNNKLEMGSSLSEIVSRISKDSAYIQQFRSAFGGKEPVNASNLKKAIAVYIRSLTSLYSPFDQYMVGTKKEIEPGVYNGFNLFMGKAKCGTCHFAPLFNGLVPPRFVKMESEVIGVPSTTDTINPKLDPDLGRFGILPVNVVRHAFKTTTVRNIALTAPYMHNGVYATLEEVVDFYDKGGGAGLGIAPEHLTLPFDKLNLSATEKKNIVAFLHSLTDTSSIRRY